MIREISFFRPYFSSISVSAFEKLKLIGIVFDLAGEILRPEKVLNFLKRSRMFVT